MRPVWRVSAWALTTLLLGCSSLTVTKVTDANRDKVAGIRYSLPKPFIQVIPQADDTILVNVVYLPDKDNTYAIQTSSDLSSYTYQVSLNQNGTLAAVEFKADTSAVGQQLAASAAAASAQIYNMNTAQLLADQTAINSAQAAVDAAQAAYDVAAAQLEADLENNVSEMQLNIDKATKAAKLAALQDAKAVLERVRSTNLIANYTAMASNPIPTTNPTATAGFLGAQNWGAPVEYELPEHYGPVLFAVNEKIGTDKQPEVRLVAAALGGNKQPVFEDLGRARLAAPFPTFQTTTQQIPRDAMTAQFRFTAAVNTVEGCEIFSPSLRVPSRCAFSDTTPNSDRRSITVTLPTMPRLQPGPYSLSARYTFQTVPNLQGRANQATVGFVVQ